VIPAPYLVCVALYCAWHGVAWFVVHDSITFEFPS
jgi:hypothetical protein